LIPCIICHNLLLWQNIHVHRGQSSKELATIGAGKCLSLTFVAFLLLFRCIWARRLGSSHDSITIAIASGLIRNGRKMLLDVIIIKYTIQKGIVIGIVQSFPCRTTPPPHCRRVDSGEVTSSLVVVANFLSLTTFVTMRGGVAGCGDRPLFL